LSGSACAALSRTTGRSVSYHLFGLAAAGKIGQQ
jgi:hypothetical protein